MTSDAELIARSLAGDGETFVEVIRRHEAAVGAYLARRAALTQPDAIVCAPSCPANELTARCPVPR